MKIGITGASGFIGKRLVKKLEEDGLKYLNSSEEMFKMKMKYSGAHQNRK